MRLSEAWAGAYAGAKGPIVGLLTVLIRLMMLQGDGCMEPASNVMLAATASQP